MRICLFRDSREVVVAILPLLLLVELSAKVLEVEAAVAAMAVVVVAGSKASSNILLRKFAGRRKNGEVLETTGAE